MCLPFASDVLSVRGEVDQRLRAWLGAPTLSSKKRCGTILPVAMIDTPVIPLADRTALLTPTAVNTILAEIRQLQAQGHVVASLMRGEPDFPTPPHIAEAAHAAIRAGRTRYPDNRGEPLLRDAVVTALRRKGLDYDAATEVLVTTGATLGI